MVAVGSIVMKTTKKVWKRTIDQEKELNQWALLCRERERVVDKQLLGFACFGNGADYLRVGTQIVKNIKRV